MGKMDGYTFMGRPYNIQPPKVNNGCPKCGSKTEEIDTDTWSSIRCLNPVCNWRAYEDHD